VDRLQQVTENIDEGLLGKIALKEPTIWIIIISLSWIYCGFVQISNGRNLPFLKLECLNFNCFTLNPTPFNNFIHVFNLKIPHKW